MISFFGLLTLSSCQKNSNEPDLEKQALTENRDGSSGFCTPAQLSNCDPQVTESVTLTVQNCPIKVSFKQMTCRVGPNLIRIIISDFIIDWANSGPCAKIGIMNSSIPAYGNGDWSAFLLQYNDLFREITNKAELFVLNKNSNLFDEVVTLDFIETKCLKFCYSSYASVEEPYIPHWTEYTCSLDGCCFRQTIYIYNFNTFEWEVHARNVIPGNLCSPEIPINCPGGGGSDCQEPCDRL